MFVCLFSQGGQLVGLMPVLAACHLIYVFSVVLHCISIMMWQIKFSLSLSIQSLKSVNLSAPDLQHFTADTLCYTVTLTFDPVTLKVCLLGRDRTTYQILAILNNPRLNYSDLKIEKLGWTPLWISY